MSADTSTAGTPGTGRTDAEYNDLHQRHHRTITQFVATRVRRFDQADVDDLVQVVFLRAWTAWPAFTGTTEAQERAWLGTIARRAVCDHYRRGPNLQRAAERPTGPEHPVWYDLHTAHPDPADRVCALVDTAASMRAVGEEHRRAVQLRVVEELSWAQAAAQMHRGKTAVRRLVTETLTEAGAGVSV